MKVLHCLNQGIKGQVVSISGQILITHCNGDDGSGGNEGRDAGGEPLVGGGHIGADVGDVVIFDGDDEVYACVGKGL